MQSRWTRELIPLAAGGLPSTSDVFRIINNKFIRGGAAVYQKNSNCNITVLEHSLYTARLLSAFAVPKLTIAGLLHDYGQIALGNVTSELSGLPHGTIGYHLLGELGFPIDVCIMIRNHQIVDWPGCYIDDRLQTGQTIQNMHTANQTMSFTYASYLLGLADKHAVGHIPNFDHYNGIEEFRDLFNEVLGE